MREPNDEVAGADEIWDRFVDLVLTVGAVEECRSRYGDKPAIRLGQREIAHSEAPGRIDIRITRAGWRKIRADYADDSAIVKEPTRTDWLELRFATLEDLAGYRPVLHTLIESNT
ncbi:hypothetical protein [Kribbella sp. NPDC055071]